MRAGRATLLAFLAAGGLAGWAAGIEPRRLEVVRLRVRLPALPPELDGLRVAHLSDFHAGGVGVSQGLLARARAAALAFAPEVVALTGDFYDYKATGAVHDVFDCWPSGMLALGVIGNHDAWQGEERVAEIVAQLTAGGVRVLRNDAVAVTLRGREVWVAGVDDPFTWLADEERAIAQLPPGERALLFLTHSPASLGAFPHERAALLLSGHTHGGQIRLRGSGAVPGTWLLRRIFEHGPRREPEIHRGVHLVDGMVAVVSDGIGTSLIPVRFRTRPQVILLELRAAASGPPAVERLRARPPR